MQKILMAIAALFICVGVTNRAQACHFAAADIYVTYTGAGADGCSSTTEYKYDITLKVYHACQTCYLDAGQNQTVYYRSLEAENASVPGASGNIPVTSNPLPDTSHQLCEAFADSNSCRQLSTRARFPAFRLRTYTGTVTLPSAQTDWRFFWSNGGRNASNLTGCGSLYIEAGLNNVAKYNNSTPRFESNPLPYICINQPTIYLNRPVDYNDDSVRVFQQIPYTPTGGGVNQTGQQCGYQAGYSVNDPIGSNANNPYTLNQVTGAANFTPTTSGFFVFAFRAVDYERGTGTQLSYVYRDVQVSVLPCTSPPPGIDSIAQVLSSIKNATVVNTPSQGDVIYACPGNEIEFAINSKTDSTTHNVYMSAIPSAEMQSSTFTVSGQGSNNVTGTFAWTPTSSHIGDHTLTIFSKDSTCTTWQPIVLTSVRVILVRIVGGIDAGPDLPICELNPDTVQLFVRGTEHLDIEWSTDRIGQAPIGLSDETIHNPKALPPYTVNYIIETPQLVDECKARDTVSVFYDETNKVVITPKNPNNPKDAMVLCRPGYVQLEALLSGRPPKNNVGCGIGSPTICSQTDTNTVFGSSVYGRFSFDTLGAVTPVMYNTLRTSRMQYLIRKKEMDEADIFSSTIRSIGFETGGTTTPNHEYTNFRILIKCTEKESLSKADGFEDFGMTQVYYSPSETFEDGMHFYSLSTPYNWDTTKNIIIQICYSDNPTVDVNCGVTSAPPVVPYVPTTYSSGLFLTGAAPSVTSVCGIDKDSRIEEVQGRPAFTFIYCEADPLDFVITWKQNEYLSDSTIMQPLAYVPKSTRFIVETIGRSECVMRDTLDIYVPNNEYKIEPTDTAICFGEQTPISAYGGFKYVWWEYENGTYVDASNSLSCTDCPEPIFSPKKTTTYRLAVSDSVFCFDTFQVNMEILPLPDVRILTTDDTTIKYGQSFKMLVSGARLYNWSPVSSLNNSNISYPIARPLDDTRYIVSGIGANGCKAYDTLHVTVDERDKLFIPSAFSPNGDGKNDVFRVANLTFQRILEFRVFNRWGEEIYSTNDSRAGWNGTLNGKDADMGTYSYLIRVSFPDGYVETYSGEVTLVR